MYNKKTNVHSQLKLK